MPAVACGSCRDGYDGSAGRCCACKEGRRRAYRMWRSFERERDGARQRAEWLKRRSGSLVRLAEVIEAVVKLKARG